MAAKHILGWSLAMVGVIAAGPLVLGRSQPSYRPALDEIALMSEVERDALNRRYQQYKSMSEAERANLRQLHLELEADRTRGARLLPTMHDYCDWLKLIDAWQQDELVHIADPLARAKRVNEIHTERQQKATGSPDENPDDPRLLFERFTLSEDQLSRMFDVLAKRLTNVSEDDLKAIAAAKGLKRWGIQMKLLNKQVPVDRLFQTLAAAELKEMIDASGHTELAQLLSEKSLIPEQRRKEMIRRSFGTSLFMQKRREATNLTDEQLQAFFAQLPRERQDQLLRLRADEFKNQLRFLSMEQDPDIQILHQMLGPLFRNSQQMLDRPGMFGGPDGPGGGPFRPEDGERRPFRPGFDGRRGGDGRPDGRPEGRPFRDGRDGFGPGRPDNGPPPEGPPPEGEPPRRNP